MKQLDLFVMPPVEFSNQCQDICTTTICTLIESMKVTPCGNLKFAQIHNATLSAVIAEIKQLGYIMPRQYRYKDRYTGYMNYVQSRITPFPF